MPRLILASTSPRRRELLALSGWAFEVRAAHADETLLPNETPAALVRRLSEIKARHVAAQVTGEALVIGADTVVAFEQRILGKPADVAEAIAMLKQLRGQTHAVFTGLTVLETRTGEAHTDVVQTRVPMRVYSDAELLAYVATGDPLDKAGAYAIQHPFQPVAAEHFNECFANVMGLPLCHLLRRLRALGVKPPTLAASLPAACQAFIPYNCPVSESILNEALI